jgi:hypothetical protein
MGGMMSTLGGILVMYQSMCKFWWGEGSGEENGFHIWPRIEDFEVVKG